MLADFYEVQLVQITSQSILFIMDTNKDEQMWLYGDPKNIIYYMDY